MRETLKSATNCFLGKLQLHYDAIKILCTIQGKIADCIWKEHDHFIH